MNDSVIVTASNVAQQLGKTSRFDTASIFIVVVFVLFVIFFISVTYKVLITKFDEIKKRLDEFHVSCKERGTNTITKVDESINYINIQIENIFNSIIELMGEGMPCPTTTAISIFSVFMELHCMKKANKLYERIKTNNGSVEQMLNVLSNEFRLITEAEKEILDKIRYTNAHKLGSELDFILEEKNWNEFIYNNVAELVSKFVGKNPNWLDVYDETMAMFMKIISPMKENIRRKGGL